MHASSPVVFRSTRASRGFGQCLAVLLAALISNAEGIAQTTRPARFDHEALLAKVRENPLSKPPLLGKDAKPLSEAQAARIQETEKTLAEARSLIARGEYAAAATLTEQVRSVRAELLAANHPHYWSAAILAESIARRLKLPEDVQARVKEADAKVASAESLQEKGKYAEALAAAREAADAFEKLLPEEDPSIAAALTAGGSAAIEMGLLDEAEIHLSKALSILETTYGTTHPALARVLDRLGWLSIYQSAGKAGAERGRKAVDYFSRALRILGRTVGETAEYAESLDNRGTVHSQIGNTDEALKDKLRALVIRETVLGPDAKDTGVSYSNLAWLYSNAGEFELAHRLRKKSLAIFETHLPEDHPYRHLEKGNLARDYLKEGKGKEALKLFEEMYAADKAHPDTPEVGAIDRAAELATIYLRMGRAEKAVPLFDEVLERCKPLRAAGKKVDARNLMMRVLKACTAYRIYREGVKYHEVVVAWDDEDRGAEDDAEKANLLATLGALRAQTGETEKAKENLHRAIERIEKLGGKTSLDLASPLMNLARIHSRTGEMEKAESPSERVLRITEQHAGSQALPTGYALMSLGRMQALAKKTADAEFSFSEAQKIFDAAGGRDPGGEVRIRIEKAQAAALSGDTEKTDALLREAMTRAEDIAKRADSVHVKATLLEVYHLLLEHTTAPKDAAEREAWITRLKSLAEDLRIAHALMLEEEGWLKEVQK
ncbi:MAG TPA: tetratricopeptide repeat protein [Phycisphaerae bacterium]|nr:tetratricopeptide repeat protein [Phycisphaerae bacterium]